MTGKEKEAIYTGAPLIHRKLDPSLLLEESIRISYMCVVSLGVFPERESSP